MSKRFTAKQLIEEDALHLSMHQRRALVVSFVLVSLSVFIFGPHLRAPFIYDDKTIILGSPAALSFAAKVRHALGLAQDERLIGMPPPRYSVLSPDYWNKVHVGTPGVYRPTRELMFGVMLALFGPQELVFHSISLFIHIAVVLLVYALGRKLLKSRAGAAVGAAFFAVHPVHVEAVQWAKNLAELMCGFGVLASAILFLRAVRGSRPDLSEEKSSYRCQGGVMALIVSVALYILGLLTKEMALALPVFMTCAILAEEKRERRGALWYTIPFWFFAVSYVLLQFKSFDLATALQQGMQKIPEEDERLWLRPALVGRTYAYYFRLLLWPFQLSAQHHFYFPTNYHENITWPYLAGFVAALAAAIGLWRIETSLLPLVVWPFAFLAPASNIIPFRGRPVGEQRLYVPSIGFCLLFGGVYEILTRNASRQRVRLVQGMMFVPFIIFFAQSLFRGEVWDSPHRFWKDLLRKSPIQTEANSAIAELYTELGYHRAALNHCDIAIHYYRFEADHFAARMTQGRALGALGQHDLALESFQRAVKLRPDDAQAHLYVGLALCNMGRFEEGLVALRRARELNPGDPLTTCDIAQALSDMGRPEEARLEWERALAQARELLKKHPRHPDFRQAEVRSLRALEKMLK